MNVYLPVIIAILIGRFVLSLVVEICNMRSVTLEVPDEFSDVYDRDKYKKSQEYLRENTRFDLFQEGISLVIMIGFILAGGFNFFDGLARGVHTGPVVTGLVFAGLLLLCNQIISIPFSVYETFVIEEKYGFNKTTVKTFIVDLLKAWALTALIGSIVFSVIVWFFLKAGPLAWAYCWGAVTLFQVVLLFIAPAVILPLFNKFIPLEQGELKERIQSFARSQDFTVKEIFKIDASRRSSKSNAYFTGFGRFRRIALFDTLIEKHTTDELVSVLAHEIGHYKKGHIIKNMVLSFMVTGILFFILSLFINNQGLFAAFKMSHVSVYASLFFVGFLFTPINMFFSVLTNIISRKYEYEADRYAVEKYARPDDFINALKRLSVDNLSNLTPHFLKVFLEYSHPPVLQRIKVIRRLRDEP